jgi:hypothetical protein
MMSRAISFWVPMASKVIMQSLISRSLSNAGIAVRVSARKKSP